MGAAPDYDALWNSILDSPIAGTYVAELHSLASDVVALAEEVFDAAPRPKTKDDYLRVNPSIMSMLFTLLGNAARISALLTERPRGKRSARDYKVHKRRVRWLRTGLLKSVKLERVFEAKVRHSLEHFDEFIDSTAARFATGNLPTPSLAPIDIVVSRRRTLERFPVGGKPPHLHYMRVFVASERAFINCGREINVQALRDECRRIAKRLKPYVPEGDKPRDERGSSMLVITPETFNP